MRKAIVRLDGREQTAYGVQPRPVRPKLSRRDARRILKKYEAKK